MFRIFNLAGPFMNHPSDYALGSILLDILSERAIHIRAPHPVVRGYTHVGDLLNIALSVLMRQEDAGPIDAGGQPEIEIGDLARRAARLLGKPDIDIRRPPLAPGSPDIYVAHCEDYQALAAAVWADFAHVGRTDCRDGGILEGGAMIARRDALTLLSHVFADSRRLWICYFADFGYGKWRGKWGLGRNRVKGGLLNMSMP